MITSPSDLGFSEARLNSSDLSQEIGSPGVNAKDGAVRLLARAIGSTEGADGERSRLDHIADATRARIAINAMFETTYR